VLLRQGRAGLHRVRDVHDVTLQSERTARRAGLSRSCPFLFCSLAKTRLSCDGVDQMIPVTNHISLDEGELHWDFVRSSGPGGQNVNKVATAVQLRFDVKASPNLSPEVKQRVSRIAGRRMTSEGVLIITAQRFRYQERNRQDALERLVSLIRDGATPPKRRIKTAPTRSSREERIREKKLRGLRKQNRTRSSGKHEE
jgi:ribosome-associated protein